MHRFFSLVVVLSALFSITTPVNAANTAPKHIFGVYSKKIYSCFSTEEKPEGFTCKGTVEDRVEVRPKPNQKIEVSIKLNFIDKNTCNFQGSGEWKKGKVIVEKQEEDIRQSCILELSFSGPYVAIKTEGNCRKYCGTRGTLDGATLKKRSEYFSPNAPLDNQDKQKKKNKVPIPNRI